MRDNTLTCGNLFNLESLMIRWEVGRRCRRRAAAAAPYCRRRWNLFKSSRRRRL